MKFFKKTHLSLALSTVLAAGALVGAHQASANQDVTPGVATGAPGDPYVSNNTLGQAMIFPYYTVRGGKSSIINIFNTGNTTIVAKVRFHESHNSRDVLDFNLVLSPFDKWSGTIENNATSGAVFKTRDSSCTVPQIPSTGVPLNATAYNSAAFADADADQTVDRLREGYVEVIAMGTATSANAGFSFGGFVAPNTGNVAYNSTHVNGVPRSCNNVDAAFVVNSGVAAGQAPASSGTGFFTAADAVAAPLNIAGGNGAPLAASEFDGMFTGNNPLRGALTIVDTTSGVGFGTAAVAIADFQDPAAILASPLNGIGANGNFANLVTAQRLPYFLEPTLASRDGLWTTTGLADVEASMAANTVINEWANNPINGANTDWVIQFPTKAFHVDIPYASTNPNVGCSDTNIQAATNRWRGNGLVGATNAACAAGVAATLPPFTSRFTSTGSPVQVTAVTVDKEERQAVAGGVSFSPAQPTAGTSIPWESNVVTFSGAGGTSVLASDSPELALTPVASIPNSDSNGQALLTLGPAGGLPLPVIGFVAKERNQGDATLSFGQIMQHSYR